MKVVDLANELLIDEMPQGTSISAVAHWIRGTIGYLNTMLYEDFSISPINYEILDNSHTREYYQQNWYIKEASEILSLLNATEERKGDKCS